MGSSVGGTRREKREVEGRGRGGGEKDKSGKRVLAANLPRLEYIATGMAERNIVPRRKPQP